MGKTVVFDVETHSADMLYTMPPEEFVRLIGYKFWGEDDVFLTEDLEELRDVLREARGIVGHNIHSFDLPATFGIKSNEPLEMAMEKKVYDTWTHAVLVNPPPFMYVNRFGKNAKADGPGPMRAWFSLDEQAHQLGVPGKTHNLKELAKEFGGFGEIPTDDPRFREYLIGDVRASEAVAKELLKKGPLDGYAYREQEIEARKTVIQCNGFRVDLEAAQTRVDELKVRREEIMAGLVEKYDFPEEGKSPWASKDGKEAIFAALADHGITPENRKDWTKTATGNPSLGGETLIELTKGTGAEEMGKALAELKGQRSLAQLAIDCTHADGKVHPDITMLQASGRWSTTEPGLTVWTARGEGAVEKAYFLPDDEDQVLLEFDYSNADARMVAALSGDTLFAERFEPGADGHMINAITAWGEAKVMESPEKTKYYRQLAKPGGHGWGYRIGPGKLAKTWGLPIAAAKEFLQRMNATYFRVVKWQDSVVYQAHRDGFVRNNWGRKMRVEKGREYTQAPALMGQSGTREIVCDGLLRMPIWMLRRVKVQVHDAIIFSVPRATAEKWREAILKQMTPDHGFKPDVGGQRIEFPVTSGPAGNNWFESGH